MASFKDKVPLIKEGKAAQHSKSQQQPPKHPRKTPTASSKDQDKYQQFKKEVEKLQFERLQIEPILQDYRDSFLAKQLKKIRTVKITHIVHPHDFYMRFIDTKHPRQMLSDMQQYYNDPKHRIKLKFEPILHLKYYVMKFSNDIWTSWERVRVVSISNNQNDKDKKCCRVYLIDLGEFINTTFDQLFELVSEFGQFEPQAIRAYLLDIKPTKTDEWRKSAIKGFSELCLDKKFDSFGLKQYDDQMHSEFPEHSTRYGIILNNRSSPSTINAALCTEGWAQPIGASASRLGFIDQVLYNGIRQSNIACELTIDKIKLLLDIQTTMNDPNYGADSTRFQVNVNPGASSSSPDNIILPDSIARKLASVICTHLNSSSNFYIRLAVKVPVYEVMTKYINKCWKKITRRGGGESSAPAIKPGTFVLAQIATDDSKQLIIHRGFVQELCAESGTANIFCIDSGATQDVKMSNVHPMPKPLMQIPPFCFRVHLDTADVGPVASSNWSSAAVSSLIQTWFKESTAAYAWRSNKSSSICQLQYLSQDVHYDPEVKSWTPVAPCNNLSLSLQQDMKGNSLLLLRSALTSVGVQLGLKISNETNVVTTTNNQQQQQHLMSFHLKNLDSDIILNAGDGDASLE